MRDGMKDDQAARREMKAMLERYRAGDVPVAITLKERARDFHLARTQGQRDAVKGIMRLIRSNRIIANLDDARLESALAEAAGLDKKEPATRVNG